MFKYSYKGSGLFAIFPLSRISSDLGSRDVLVFPDLIFGNECFKITGYKLLGVYDDSFSSAIIPLVGVLTFLFIYKGGICLFT